MRALPSLEGRERLIRGEGAPLFLSDWERALFLHWEVPPAALQPLVPFPLDLRAGRAFVSAVAFTMRDLRPRRGGRLAAWCARPLATHGFLNVRTYVTHRGEPGIYFLAEWLPNALACLIGPRLFALPYRRGRLDFRHAHEDGRIEGEVAPADGAGPLRYRASLSGEAAFAPAARGSLAEFLCERYSAFTSLGGRWRMFRIWHPPWPIAPVRAEVADDALLAATGDWLGAARPAGAHYSPGVPDVWIGRPLRI